jgi:hypothetical protein
MKKRTVLFAGLTTLAAASLGAWAQSMRPGEWEFTTTMTSPSMQQPQTGSVNKCVSQAEASDPASFMGGDNAGGCEITRGASAPGSYSWTIACPKQGVSGTGKASYGPDRIESEINMTVALQDGGQKIQMSNKTLGRYLGPCKGK